VCNLYSITTNQAAIIALFRVMNQYVGNLPPMPGVFPDYPAPVVLFIGAGSLQGDSRKAGLHPQALGSSTFVMMGLRVVTLTRWARSQTHS
jgi:hypothetical protein